MQLVSAELLQTRFNTRTLLVKLRNGLESFLVNETINLETALKIKTYLKAYTNKIQDLSLQTCFKQDGDTPIVTVDGKYLGSSFGFTLRNKSIVNREYLH